jgi:cytochrome c
VLVVPPAGGTGAQQAPAEAQQQQVQQAPAETQQTPAETQQAPTEAPADLSPTLALMGEVDAKAGQAEARKCQACHALEEGGGNRVGPPLWGVVNRPVASSEGYSYSEALTAFGQGKEWDFELLDAFVQAPQKLVPGTKMAFPGIRNERDRAELLVYLNSLSDQPAPLPGGAGGGAPGQAR